MSRKRKLQLESEDAAIDMSPLIDMVFILLIFFMVSTTFVKDMKLDLNRPGAASAGPANSKSIRVHIDKYQNVYLNNQEVQLWTLESKIREEIKKNNELSLLVVSDARVPVEKLIEVVDQAKLAGVTDVGVASEGEGK